MFSWSGLTRAMPRLERSWDQGRLRLKARYGLVGPITIQPFRGYGNRERLRLRARVLESKGLERPAIDAGPWENLRRMVKRFESDEVPYAGVEVSAGNETSRSIADAEGYVRIELENAGPAFDPGFTWLPVTLTLVDSPPPVPSAPISVRGQVLVPPPDAQFGVISDVDDTIIETGAHDLFRNLRTIIFTSVEGRTAFPGVAAFYRGLAHGTADQPRNPIFYVSSAPWNLYDFLERFLEVKHLPLGPLFLRDIGFNRQSWGSGKHRRHKLEVIDTLMEFYPNMSFMLVGDSGQHDAAIYAEAVRRHPDRICAVYIRDLALDRPRDGEIHELLAEVRAAGARAEIGPNMIEAAEDAAEQGWISAASVDAVRREVAGG